MKTLVVEDDFTSRLLLQEILQEYGEVHIAVNGKEAVQAVELAIERGTPYSLICLDIMMPEMDGQAALQAIRNLEERAAATKIAPAKILMTSALGDKKSVMAAFREQCDGYIVKPLDVGKLIETIKSFGLI